MKLRRKPEAGVAGISGFYKAMRRTELKAKIMENEPIPTVF